MRRATKLLVAALLLSPLAAADPRLTIPVDQANGLVLDAVHAGERVAGDVGVAAASGPGAALDLVAQVAAATPGLAAPFADAVGVLVAGAEQLASAAPGWPAPLTAPLLGVPGTVPAAAQGLAAGAVEAAQAAPGAITAPLASLPTTLASDADDAVRALTGPDPAGVTVPVLAGVDATTAAALDVGSAATGVASGAAGLAGQATALTPPLDPGSAVGAVAGDAGNLAASAGQATQGAVGGAQATVAAVAGIAGAAPQPALLDIVAAGSDLAGQASGRALGQAGRSGGEVVGIAGDALALGQGSATSVVRIASAGATALCVDPLAGASVQSSVCTPDSVGGVTQDAASAAAGVAASDVSSLDREVCDIASGSLSDVRQAFDLPSVLPSGACPPIAAGPVAIHLAPPTSLARPPRAVGQNAYPEDDGSVMMGETGGTTYGTTG